MSMLAELVEVVIGVDTHSQTHTAAVLDARTGAVLAGVTTTADPDGYAELVALAEAHSGLRAWAMEGTGGYGAGLARHLADREELVVELDRPKRPARRAGANSDPIDAERAARDALARTDPTLPSWRDRLRRCGTGWWGSGSSSDAHEDPCQGGVVERDWLGGG